MDASDRSENHPRSEEQTDAASVNSQENDVENSQNQHENDSTDNVLLSTQQSEQSSESSDDWSEEEDQTDLTCSSEERQELVRRCLRRANIIRDLKDIEENGQPWGAEDPLDEASRFNINNRSEVSGESTIIHLIEIFRDPENIEEALRQLEIYDKQVEEIEAKRAPPKVNNDVAPQSSSDNWLIIDKNSSGKKMDSITGFFVADLEKLCPKLTQEKRKTICEKHMEALQNKTSH